MPLAIPLESSQIAAAQRLYTRCEQWQLTDKTLAALREHFPGFSPHEVLLKAVTINSLYYTNVLAIERMARHVTAVMSEAGSRVVGPELVELIASPGPNSGTQGRRFYSFASKFAHFFVVADRYPIKDSYAEQMIGLHLGQERMIADADHPYVAFCRNYELLKTEARFRGSNREMDHYLWLGGEYLAWQTDRKARINAEARMLLKCPHPRSPPNSTPSCPPSWQKPSAANSNAWKPQKKS